MRGDALEHSGAVHARRTQVPPRTRRRVSASSTPRGLGLLALAGLCCLCCLASCGEPPRPRNLVLILTDTLRADKLGCYGDEAGLTPYLDRLASESVLFENASAHAPWTLPSTASLLTSLHPRQHGAGGRAPRFTGLDPRVRTLAEVLRERGFATHAVVNVLFLDPTFGLTRGFDEVDVEHHRSNIEVRNAERTTDAALAWLEESGAPEPFFLLVHYFDPHAVYAPPQPFRKKFAAPPDQTDESFVFGTRQFMAELRFGGAPLDAQLVARAERLYEGEIAYTDGQIGRLLDGLRERGLLDDSLVVFSADHGEEFLDHGGFEHGHTLYPELTHVPLLLRYPPRLAPKRVAQSVGQVDVAPTLLELLDIAAPAQFVGESLVPLLSDPALPDRAVLAHGNMWGAPLTSLRSEGQLLILPAPQPGSSGAPELYDWRADPRCQHDLAAPQPERVERLRALLAARERSLLEVGRGAEVELSPQQLEGLKGLGYGEQHRPDAGD